VLVAVLLAGGCGPSRDGEEDGGGGPCSEFEDEPGDAGETVIEVRNRGTQPVYLLGLNACDFTRLLVTPQGGDPGADHWPARKCEPRCEEVLDGGEWGCDLSCPYATPIKIDPGGHYTETWDGTLQLVRTPPDQCCREDGCFDACLSAAPAPEADYTARVNVITDVTCDGGMCDCTSNEDGWCEISGFADVAESDGSVVTADFSTPASTATIEL